MCGSDMSANAILVILITAWEIIYEKNAYLSDIGLLHD